MVTHSFPPRWDEDGVTRLIAHCESLSDEEQLAEDEAAVRGHQGQTVITVPDTLLPAIRQLLSETQSK